MKKIYTNNLSEIKFLKSDNKKNNAIENYEKTIISKIKTFNKYLSNSTTFCDFDEELKNVSYYIYRNNFEIENIKIIEKELQNIEIGNYAISDDIKQKFENLKNYLFELRRKNMVFVPGGKLLYSLKLNNKKNDIEQKFDVQIKPFFMDRFLVSVSEFLKVCPEFKSKICKYKKLNEPVRGISYKIAELYANKVGKRLPDELEWVYASMGLKNFLYFWGNSIKTKPYFFKDLNNFSMRSTDYFNFFGLYYMNGIVWQWVSPSNYRTDTIFKNKALLKGGSWKSNLNEMKNTYVLIHSKAFEGTEIGFRCVI